MKLKDGKFFGFDFEAIYDEVGSLKIFPILCQVGDR